MTIPAPATRKGLSSDFALFRRPSPSILVLPDVGKANGYFIIMVERMHPCSPFTYTIKLISGEEFPFTVLWDNTTRFVFTLAAAVIGLVAYFLFPSRHQVELKVASFYERKGKWALFVISFLTLGLSGVLGWEFVRYNVRTAWVGVNLALYAVLGAVLLAGNIITMRAVKHATEHVDIVEAEVVELSAENGGQPGLIGEMAAAGPLPEPLPTPEGLEPRDPGFPKE